MPHLDDTLELATDVELDGNMLVDRVRGTHWPVNSTAVRILQMRDRPLGAVAHALARESAIEDERARQDVLVLAWQLNRALVANLRPAGGRGRRLWAWLMLTLRRLPTGALPPSAARRRALKTQSTRAAVSGVAVAAGSRAVGLAMLVSVLAVQPPLLVGAWSATVVAGSCGLGAAVGAGLVLHEAGHVAALQGVPAALVLDGRRTFVLHGPVDPSRRALVALAGPAVPLVIGVAMVVLALALSEAVLALCAAALSGHGVALSALTNDGRRACGL